MLFTARTLVELAHALGFSGRAGYAPAQPLELLTSGASDLSLTYNRAR